MKLSQKEEYLMNLIWQMEKAYMKDLMDAHSDPKPAPTTMATLLKRMTDKGAIDFNLIGNSRQYYPLISKTEYSTSYVDTMISTFFQGSTSRFASFFASNSSMTKDELQELRSIIDNQIKKTDK